MPPLSSPSSIISRWLPLSPLGSGSFGHVSLALNLADGSLFAAKSSPFPLLLTELTILQSLNSPFIIQCLGADLRPSLPHLFLEYMDVGSLSDVLRRSSSGKLCDDNTIRYYTRAIVQGLDYLHQNGVVHCDIKSHNVLIGQSGVKIGDFGVARRTGELAPASMDGALRGTPLWMAPEVLRGEEQGTPSDIWSLGCTVVEMLQGKPPWGHITSLEALLLKVGSSEENPPLPEHISAAAKEFLLNCLRRDPKERATAAELLQHPFLCGREEELEAQACKSNQPSPRSTLDFWYSSESESDCGCESMLASVPSLLSPLCMVAPSSPVGRRSAEAGNEWVNVRRAGECSRMNEAFFMPAFYMPSEEALEVKRGCEVSFDCAAFLKKRRTTVG